MVIIVESPPVLGWLVDPSLELQEAGVECAWKPHNKWQWRADDIHLAERREDAVERSYNNRHAGIEEKRDPGSTSHKQSIFRKLKHKMHVTKVSSTDAVTDEAPSNFKTSIVPAMIHVQRVSSIDSVECVLADVFMLPTASSTLTEDDEFSDDSGTTLETVVIDEEALETEYNHGVSCKIKAPTKDTFECILAANPSIPSISSSTMMTIDSSDDEERLADLIMDEEEERDACNIDNQEDLDILQDVSEAERDELEEEREELEEVVVVPSEEFPDLSLHQREYCDREPSFYSI